MAIQQFFLCGDGVSTAVELDISAVQNIDELKRSISAHYGIVQPEGVAFQAGETELSELYEIIDSTVPVGVTVNGHSVRDVPGPQGLPWVGNYFEGIRHPKKMERRQLIQPSQFTLITSETTSDCSTSTGLYSGQRTWARLSARPMILLLVRLRSQKASSSRKRSTTIIL